MSTVERRAAARANQRAAAFIRFQMLGDHEAMHFLLVDAGETERARLEFTTALASIAASLATSAFVGTQPWFRQVPPSWARSTIATCRPRRAAVLAAA